jgi:NADPH:quinone reductase-like Zn-dependent oxidoreductase
MSTLMQAVRMTDFGGPEVMQLAQVPVPVPGPGDILMRVAACGIDRKDLLVRNGTIRKKSVGYRAAANDARTGIDLPLTLGAEIAGTIVAVGSAVHGFKVGDRVASLPRRGHCGVCLYCHTGRSESCASAWFIGQDADGGYADYVLVGPDGLCHVPDGVDLVEASLAAACIGPMIRAVRDVAQVRIGETVLITGASGGLGVHGVQLAKGAGARVIAVASSAAKAERLRALGADEVIVVARGHDFSEQVLALTGGHGVDVGIDIVGAAALPFVLRGMALYGRVIIVGETGSGKIDLRPAIVLLRRLQILASYAPGVTHMVAALQLLERGQIRAIIDSRRPLEEAVHAHHLMESGGDVFGRIVLVPSHDV